MDFDKVLVLSHGEAVEFDTPSNLLSKGTSQFSALCRDSGNYTALKEMAKSAETEH